jgi:hypothetical protein
MSVLCQLVEYAYRREPFPNSVLWQLTGRIVSELLEGGEPGFWHQASLDSHGRKTN